MPDSYNLSSAGNISHTGHAPQRVSRSDYHLFGDLANIVRQLGIAADAAKTAREEVAAHLEEFIKVLGYADVKDKSRETQDALRKGDLEATVEVLYELEQRAFRAHRVVAKRGIEESARASGGDDGNAASR